MTLKIVPIRADFLSKVRNAGLDDQDQRVEKFVAQGGEVCRDVLRGAYPGEEVIAASYCPFSLAGPYKEYGPIFVLANETKETVLWDVLPNSTEKETDYIKDQVVLRAYDATEHITMASVVLSVDLELSLQNYLSQESTAFVLVRYVAYGCYSFRVERDNCS